jgi:hypothetical protein
MSHLRNKSSKKRASSAIKSDEEYAKFMLEEIERAVSSGKITELYAKQLREKYSTAPLDVQKEH